MRRFSTFEPSAKRVKEWEGHSQVRLTRASREAKRGSRSSFHDGALLVDRNEPRQPRGLPTCVPEQRYGSGPQRAVPDGARGRGVRLVPPSATPEPVDPVFDYGSGIGKPCLEGAAWPVSDGDLDPLGPCFRRAKVDSIGGEFGQKDERVERVFESPFDAREALVVRLRVDFHPGAGKLPRKAGDEMLRPLGARVMCQSVLDLKFVNARRLREHARREPDDRRRVDVEPD